MEMFQIFHKGLSTVVLNEIFADCSCSRKGESYQNCEFLADKTTLLVRRSSWLKFWQIGSVRFFPLLLFFSRLSLLLDNGPIMVFSQTRC